MEPSVIEEGGVKFVEGQPDVPLQAGPDDIDRVLEACFSAGARAAPLYAEGTRNGDAASCLF